jgi:glycosyltransferase involved in cell wall biosynthesis
MATRDKATYLELTLATLERQTFPADAWELVVVDDASVDGTPSVLEKYAGRERMHLSWHRYSQCRDRAVACNDALEAARGRIVVFLVHFQARSFET